MASAPSPSPSAANDSVTAQASPRDDRPELWKDPLIQFSLRVLSALSIPDPASVLQLVRAWINRKVAWGMPYFQRNVHGSGVTSHL